MLDKQRMSKKQNLIIRLEAITEKAKNNKKGWWDVRSEKSGSYTRGRVRYRGIEVFQHARLN